MAGDAPTQRFGFLLLPRFALLAFTSAVEPLRAANLLSGRPLYTWRFLTHDGAPATASNGAQVIAQATPAEAGPLDCLVVCGGVDAHLFRDRGTLAWLRRAARGGARIGAVSDGSFVLARAGLLEGHRCTIHWQCAEGFREAFPEIALSDALYELDRQRFTCSGGTSSMDMMLQLIEERHGRALALRVAEQFLHERLRESGDGQRPGLRERVGVGHPKLLEAVRVMEANLEAPLPAEAVARRAGLSTRQLERLARQHLGATPQTYYLELRLRRARHLLSHSTLSVTEVALACGFVSGSHFARRYRARYAEAPRATRLGKGAGGTPG